PSTRIRVAVAFNPAADLTVVAKEGPAGTIADLEAFLGVSYGQRPELWREASATAHPGAAPILVLHGDADRTLPYRQSAEFVRQLKAAGVDAELFTAPGGDHGFYNKPPFFEPTVAAMEAFLLRFLAR